MSTDAAGIVPANGRLVLVTQGITGGTLVAGKQCLFRVYLPQADAGSIDRILATITRPAPLAKVAIVATKAYLTVETAYPHGPSVGCIVRGYAFPRSGSYDVALSLEDASGNLVAAVGLTLSFVATYDLRLLIVPLQGSAPQRNFVPTPAWYTDLDAAMHRVGSMLPVRDCVRKELNGTRKQGIRYHVGTPKEAWPSEVGLTSVDYWEEYSTINAAAGANDDHLDATILFRPNQAGESPGGNAVYCAQPRQCQVIGGVAFGSLLMSAPAMAQELGHTLCLEPTTSPSFDGTAHAKTVDISDPLAYDFINQRPYPEPGRILGDVMGLGAWQGADSVAFTYFDWNYLLTQSLPNLGTAASTGSDVNPAIYDPCGNIEFWPLAVERPRPPNEWHGVIGSLVDGKQWIWGPHGPDPVPGDGPLGRGRPQPAAIRSLLGTLRRLQAARVTEVYLPLAHDPISIVRTFLPTLHRDEAPYVGGARRRMRVARARAPRAKAPAKKRRK